MNSWFFGVAIVFACVLHLNEAIRCYKCDSQYTSECADPFEHNSLRNVMMDCNQLGGGGGGGGGPFGGGIQGMPGQYGRYVCSKTTFKVGDRWMVQRDCAPSDGSDRDTCASTPNGGYNCRCLGDGCNSATRGTLMSWLTLTVIGCLALVFSRR